MYHGGSMTLERAREMAGALVELLAPACQRIEIAGSVRRKKPDPNDIELVAVPIVGAMYQATLFSGVSQGSMKEGVNLLDTQCDDLLRQSILEKRPNQMGRHCWGTGIKRMVFYQGTDYAPVDLFQVVEPAEWGVIFAIRTGPGDFNRLLVTNRRWGGACPHSRKVAGGRVWRLSALADHVQAECARMPAAKFVRALTGRPEVHVLHTPTEEDFFREMGIPCWLPEERTLQRLQAYLRQTTRR
jgi:hypothetical protein